MSREQKTSFRKTVATVIVAAACLLIAVQYALMIEPAAANELDAACTALRPAAENASLGSLPSDEVVDFTATSYDGKPVRLSDYRGKVVFVNFWATWCGVCEAEKPGLEEMASLMRDGDFEVLTLASNHTWKEVADYAARKFPDGTSFDVLLDPPASEDDNLGTIARSFGISKVPDTLVIDREGKVHFYFVNRRDWNSDVAKTCLRGLIDGEA
ncbi:MAG: TlpA disulfide reductase family protein [Myxococcota bacterium]